MEKAKTVGSWQKINEKQFLPPRTRPEFREAHESPDRPSPCQHTQQEALNIISCVKLS
jgi:hypothetical protein